MSTVNSIRRYWPVAIRCLCCAGTHSLGSYVNDAPDYQGKRAQSWTDKLAAGKTYYIRANLDDSGRPLVVSSRRSRSY